MYVRTKGGPVDEALARRSRSSQSSGKMARCWGDVLEPQTMPRRALFLVFFLIAAARSARADEAKDAADAKALLDTIATSASKDERAEAAAKLAELGGRVIKPLGEF